MEIPPPTREPVRHYFRNWDFWFWVDRIFTGVIAALVAITLTGPIAIVGAKLSEGDTEANILFAVCFYGFLLTVTVVIYRGLRRFFGATGPALRDNPSQGTAGGSDNTVPEMPNPKRASINYIWPFIGIGLGTYIVGSLVLNTDPLQRFTGGLMYGGVPLGLLGLAYAIYRRNRQWRRLQYRDPINAAPTSGES
jgi:hypothetical protein